MEIRRMEKAVKMTLWQATVWEWWLRGVSVPEIAFAFAKDRSTIRQHLKIAQAKAARVKVRGVLTVMIEECGIKATRELLSERADINTPKHELADESWQIALEKKLLPESQRERVNRGKSSGIPPKIGV
jgi:DNA-binding CsgD family transcriptional regulator